MIREFPGLLSQSHKHALSHVLGQLRVAPHPQRGGIDKIDVPSHEFGE